MEDEKLTLELYEQEVEKDAKNRSDYLFHNEGDKHALIICSNIFKYAEKEIRIAANQLYNDEVVNTDKYIKSMEQFLNRPESSLKILIRKAPQVGNVMRDNTFYGMIFDHPAYREGRVEIRHGRGSCFAGADGKPVNFCTADDIMYRFEDDIVKRTATANFGDSEMAIHLREQFDKIYVDKFTNQVDLNIYFPA